MFFLLFLHFLSPLFPFFPFLLLTGCQQVKKWLDTTTGETITHGAGLYRHWELYTPLRSSGHVFLIKQCTGGIITALDCIMSTGRNLRPAVTLFVSRGTNRLYQIKFGNVSKKALADVVFKARFPCAANNYSVKKKFKLKKALDSDSGQDSSYFGPDSYMCDDLLIFITQHQLAGDGLRWFRSPNGGLFVLTQKDGKRRQASFWKTSQPAEGWAYHTKTHLISGLHGDCFNAFLLSFI